MATGIVALPDNALAGLFRVLPWRSLAVVRCICKAWRDIIDARALLPSHLLPNSVRGVFLNYVDHDRPHHLARPCPSSTIPKVDGMLSFLPNDDSDWWSVMDHCNGLLLCDIEWGSELCVCNPATSRWMVLPRPQVTDFRCRHYAGAYIAFDPAESAHFHVVLVPSVPEAPPSEHRRKKKKKDKEQRTLWEEEGGASFCLDWFFAMADGGEAISNVEEAEAVQREDGLFSMAEDSGAAIGEEKAKGNHEEEFQQLEEEGGTAIGEEKAEANHEDEFQQLPSSMDEDVQHDIDPWSSTEWPPTPWTLNVFSSRAGHWEERAFVRQGMAAGTVEKMRLDREEPTFYGPRRRYAVYHHGSLYVHCRGSFVVRLSLSNSEYQIIETPTKVEYAKPYLGKLQKDVCFGIVHNDHRQLKIWMLSESCGQMEWVLKYEVEVGYYAHYIASLPYDVHGRQSDGSWILEEDNTDIQERYEWDSDNDDTFTVDHLEGQEYYYQGLDIIGFHPFKEVVFMAQPFGVVAYHLETTKIQYLGNSRPKCYYRNHTNGIYESFLYTPCMIGDLLYGDETSGQSSSDEDQWFECNDADS